LKLLTIGRAGERGLVGRAMATLGDLAAYLLMLISVGAVVVAIEALNRHD